MRRRHSKAQRHGIRHVRSRQRQRLAWCIRRGGQLTLVVVLSLSLYMLKSALGIDLFTHYHLGLWGWYLEQRALWGL